MGNQEVSPKHKGKPRHSSQHHLTNPDQAQNSISVTNDIIVPHSKTSPNMDYIKLNFLGEGSFASVYRVQNRLTGQTRAMKIIKKNSRYTGLDDQSIINEINILRTMDHPNILKIFEFYSQKDSYSIITEMCAGGELFQEIIDRGPFNEKYSSYVMYQIFSAINYCHNMNIIHRDLKPENILIVKRERTGFPILKVCDFGTSKIFQKNTMHKKLVGSSYYIAPEVLQKNYNEKCDLWSCGVILYILLSGRPPFGGQNDTEILDSVSKGVYDFTHPPFDTCSKEVKHLIENLLIKDPSKRISAEKALMHPWFVINNSKELINTIRDSQLIKHFINNLKSYKCDSVIQETALAYLVHNYSQREDIVNACKLFNQMDVRGSGKINQKELLKGLKSRIESQTLEQDVEIIFKNIDGDNNGYIEYEEFVRAAIDKKSFLDENVLRFAFRYFDKDDSGEISFEEMQEIFEQNISDKAKMKQMLKRFINEVDENGDGRISFEEFSDIMRKFLIK